MPMFELSEYGSKSLYYCSCGASENEAEIVEVHPWQRLTENEVGDGYMVTAEGEDLECRCGRCGGIFWVPGRITAQA